MAGRYIDSRIDDRIEAMLAIGVDEMSWDDLNDSHYDWPSVEAVRDYRGSVKALVTQFIETMPLELPVSWDSPAWVILMGIEHERIHLETSSVLIRQLPVEWVKPQPQWPVCSEARHDRQSVPTNSLVSQPGGLITLGKTDDTYGWDNEYGTQQTELKPFKASKMLVSNAEFYTFIEAGGYQNDRWWDEEGLGWRKFARATMPTFWVGNAAMPDQLKLRLMCEEVAMPWDWPAEVNQLEAAAFCRWKAEETGKSVQLPCEAEWYQLREQVEGDQPDWDQAPGNINLAYWASSCPVDRFPQGEFFDIVGTSGSGRLRQPMALKASKFTPFTMISRHLPLMVSIHLLKVAVGYRLAMKPLNRHVMPSVATFSSMPASAMSFLPIRKPWR